MKAMVLPKIVSLDEDDTPLALVDLPVPVPKAGEVLIRVSTCGVCHTELDEISIDFSGQGGRNGMLVAPKNGWNSSVRSSASEE